MSIPSRTPPRDAASRAARNGLAVLLLTGVHHVYGAHAFGTPWRYHAVLIAGATALVILGALTVLRARASSPTGALAGAVLFLAILAVPVLGVGAFEGLYNHVVKNALYFGGASPPLLVRLFPPPTYEMPSDAFFEITGILQVVPAWFAARQLFGMLPSRRPRPSSAAGAAAPEAR